jgi:hypothetical protein
MQCLTGQKFENRMSMANTGHPEVMGLSSRTWIPAFAGMTKSGYLVTRATYALSLLAFKILTVFGQE